MKRQLNKFEAQAHDIQYRHKRPSWEHTIETYTGNRKGFDWVTPASILAIVTFIIVLFVKL